SDYDRLSKQLAETPFLAAWLPTLEFPSEIELVTKERSTELVDEDHERPFPTLIILNLNNSLRKFALLRGVGKEDRDFGLRELATIAGMSYNLTYHYVQKEVVVPHRKAGGSGRGDVEAKFSWASAFIFGVVGCLRRHGVDRIDELKRVRSLFEAKKQAVRK